MSFAADARVVEDVWWEDISIQDSDDEQSIR